MSVAVIGTGNIGSRVAGRLAGGGVDVVVAGGSLESAQQAAQQIGQGVRAAETGEAINEADTVVFATWFDVTKDLLGQYASALAGKTVVDPSNNIAPDGSGGFTNQNPEGASAGQQLAAAVPAEAHYVKAFGTLPAERLDATQTDDGDKVVLFYATDDEAAGSTAEDLITKAGFDPVRAGGVDATGRIEVFGDLHYSGLERMVGRDEAQRLVEET